MEDFTVSYKRGSKTKTVIGEVAAADRDVGISIVNKDTKTFLYCINGPLSPLRKDNPHWFASQEESKDYYRRYDFISEQVAAGSLDLDAYDKSHPGCGDEPGVAACAFGQ